MNGSGPVRSSMKHLSKVVWFEGMYLAPHHFQAQTQSFEDLIQFSTSSLWFEPYGLVGIDLDPEALRNGNVALIHGRGIFPDGLVFHMPESDALPAARNIADLFPPAQDAVTVMLTVAPRRAEGINTVSAEDAAHGNARYSAEIRVLHDETTGRDEKPVQVGRKNITLRLDTEPGFTLAISAYSQVANPFLRHVSLCCGSNNARCPDCNILNKRKGRSALNAPQ